MEALEANEPECECVPSGAPDVVDTRSCDFHNPISYYNVLLRKITPAVHFHALTVTRESDFEIF
jgi:hypothetical protein